MGSFEAIPVRAKVALAFAVAAAGVLAASAGATRVGWRETALNGRVAVLSFRVDSIELGSSRWSARVTIKNDSRRTIRVGDEFGVEIFATKAQTNLNKGLAFGHAISFSPKRPVELRPGESWTGTIGGVGHPPTSTASRYARLVFGSFVGVPGQRGAILWVTDHALRVPGTRPGPAAA